MRDEIPGAQAPYPDGNSGAVTGTTPPEDASGAPPSVALPKEYRDTLAQMGRRMQAQERALRSAQTQAQQVAEQNAALVQRIQTEDQTRWDNWLASLPPDQRAVAAAQADARAARDAVARLEGEVQRLRTSPPVPVRQESTEDYKARRTREIIAQVNREFGTQLTGQEAGLDDSDEEPFYLSARRAALDSRLSAGEQNMDTYRPSGGAVPVDAGRALSPRPAGNGRQPAVTQEEISDLMWEYDSRVGPNSIKPRLKDLHSRAAAQAGVRK